MKFVLCEDRIRLWTYVLLKSIVVGWQLLFVVLCKVLPCVEDISSFLTTLD